MDVLKVLKILLAIFIPWLMFFFIKRPGAAILAIILEVVAVACLFTIILSPPGLDHSDRPDHLGLLSPAQERAGQGAHAADDPGRNHHEGLTASLPFAVLKRGRGSVEPRPLEFCVQKDSKTTREYYVP